MKYRKSPNEKLYYEMRGTFFIKKFFAETHIKKVIAKSAVYLRSNKNIAKKRQHARKVAVNALIIA